MPLKDGAYKHMGGSGYRQCGTIAQVESCPGRRLTRGVWLGPWAGSPAGLTDYAINQFVTATGQPCAIELRYAID
jgi:hypothetical protein